MHFIPYRLSPHLIVRQSVPRGKQAECEDAFSFGWYPTGVSRDKFLLVWLTTATFSIVSF